MTRPEVRFAGRLEVRTAGDEIRLAGLACATEFEYSVGDFKETISRGAFRETLACRPDVVLLLDHDGLPLARTSSGTLQLDETRRGLEVDAALDGSDPDVQRLVPKLARGDLGQMSFAFRVCKGGEAWTDDYTRRRITAVDLDGGDVSVVTHPANEATVAALARSRTLTPVEVRSKARQDGARPARAGGMPLELAQCRAFVLGARWPKR